MTILHKTLEAISKYVDFNNLIIEDFYFGKPFCVIKLNDGSVGAAMNYHEYAHDAQQNLKKTQLLFKYLIKSDPLLINSLFKSPISISKPLLHTLRNTLINALSSKLMDNATGDFQVYANSYDIVGLKKRLDSLNFSDQVSIVGFGGILTSILKFPNINNIYVCDLNYKENLYKEKYTETLKGFVKDYSNKKVVLSDGWDYKEQFRKSKYIFITGSALSNGSMEVLLDAAQGAEGIILQGESCFIYPEVLFNDYNVELLMTTKKTENTLWYLDNNPTFFFNELFEGHNEEVYIYKNISREVS